MCRPTCSRVWSIGLAALSVARGSAAALIVLVALLLPASAVARDAGQGLDAGSAPAAAEPAPGPASGPGPGTTSDPTASDAGSGDAGASPLDSGSGPLDPGASPTDAVPADAGPVTDAAPIDANAMPVTEPADPVPEGSTGIIIKVIIGLSILFIFAYAGSHPWIQAFERRIGIAHVITAGFPFVALGVIAQSPAIGVLTPAVLETITPILNFGLGWLGFIIGLQMDLRFFNKLPRGTGLLVVIEASVPFAVITLVCGGVMVAFGQDPSDPALIRDAIMLGAAGCMTSLLGERSLAQRRWIRPAVYRDHGIEGLVSQLDEVFGLVALLILAAFVRPEGAEATWQLPGTAWVFVTIGLGATVGLLLYVMVRKPASGAEFLAVLLGYIAFASGLAGYLRLSPIVVCFIAGALLANFPCDQRRNVIRLSERMERSIHLIFLIVAGAVWSVGDWRGWLLLPCFVASRFLGRYLGIFTGKAMLEEGEQRNEVTHGPVVAPLSVLSIAMVVNVERMYASGDSSAISWLMTAVIGGAIATEMVVQLVHGDRRARPGLMYEGEPYRGPTYRGLDAGRADQGDHPES